MTSIKNQTHFLFVHPFSRERPEIVVVRPWSNPHLSDAFSVKCCIGCRESSVHFLFQFSNVIRPSAFRCHKCMWRLQASGNNLMAFSFKLISKIYFQKCREASCILLVSSIERTNPVRHLSDKQTTPIKCRQMEMAVRTGRKIEFRTIKNFDGFPFFLVGALGTFSAFIGFVRHA